MWKAEDDEIEGAPAPGICERRLRCVC